VVVTFSKNISGLSHKSGLKASFDAYKFSGVVAKGRLHPPRRHRVAEAQRAFDEIFAAPKGSYPFHADATPPDSELVGLG
jgi:hypothetical protein